jgi:hypothetical protein
MFRNIRLATLLLALSVAGTGLALAQEHESRDRDDYGYDRSGQRAARDIGFEDGSRVGRQDMAERKRFDPNPRGKYASADHGYRREYGDRDEYREQYSHAYHEAYERAFRR